ncbi:C40 family peptidase [Oceanihabitans sediminis]|uniref:Hydrolase Nlp/P60 n=1 Tax=Oceanihabitans sediminis TaxID=1812012 RepID=A0A368P391_9FLAO|nr:C40 family peptidase [Oceanihabitans sediminis]MDX1278206.1 C40 family peptidase [Oceanihabitans sediminis]MDX1773711.1 C40 family peptidase [Oceanihabitans sediminis]RBP33156.1 SH3 domain-containing protein [Oceanihabitans sediminis]RCU57337.1 hydrolase Nlp/P60 [Oceanihabitans sediminis]
MQYGICNLSIVPLRFEPSDKAELVSQVLYGDYFKILEQRKSWSKIRIAFDGYEGWIDNKQYIEITEEQYNSLNNQAPILSNDLIEFVQDKDNHLYSIPLGSTLNGLELLNHSFDGSVVKEIQPKEDVIKTAFSFLNAPYLWGGKTPFGIDCSGFTQMVYKLNGYKLLRDASQQATQGEALSFIEESEPGDLAFFDNNEGDIVHVGIIMKDNYIIHAHGKVRIDRLDHSGIYNADKRMHTHKLRVIKKII